MSAVRADCLLAAAAHIVASPRSAGASPALLQVASGLYKACGFREHSDEAKYANATSLGERASGAVSVVIRGVAWRRSRMCVQHACAAGPPHDGLLPLLLLRPLQGGWCC